MFWHVILDEAAIDLHKNHFYFTDAEATWWWWHHMGTVIVVIACLSVFAAPLLRYIEMHNAEVWVNTVATVMTTMISSMGLSGIMFPKGIADLCHNIDSHCIFSSDCQWGCPAR